MPMVVKGVLPLRVFALLSKLGIRLRKTCLFLLFPVFGGLFFKIMFFYSFRPKWASSHLGREWLFSGGNLS